MLCETGPPGMHPSLPLSAVDGHLPGLTLDALFWDTIFSVDVRSPEGLSNIVTLFHSPSKIADARSLRGDQAQRFIDLLDQFLALPHLDERLFRRSSGLLYKICKAQGMLPTSYVVQPEHIRVGEFRWKGGFADVGKGEHRGRPVAVKQLRTEWRDEFGNTFKRLCREVLIWKRLSHPNVLPLLGVSVSEGPQHFRIISEWMPNGNMIEYIKLNPEVNRLHLLSEVASGVTYLHGLGIAHGDIKGANILVDHTGTARLGDFGLMGLTDLSTIFLSNTAVPSCGTIRWTAPELLDPDSFGSDGLPSRGSDCYSLGMAIYEVLGGLVPFHHLRSLAAACAVLKGGRPGKPLNASSLGFTDELWGLLLSCWNESASARPTAQQLLNYLRPASLTWVPPPTVCPTIEAADVPSSNILGALGASLSSPMYRVQ